METYDDQSMELVKTKYFQEMIETFLDYRIDSSLSTRIVRQQRLIRVEYSMVMFGSHVDMAMNGV